MPAFLGEFYFHQALETKAAPALERLAEDSRRRDRALRRFDRSDPPPYESSTDDEELATYHPVLAEDPDAVLDEFKDLMEGPLNDEEESVVVNRLFDVSRAYDPGARYQMEARIEGARVEHVLWKLSDDARKYLRRPGSKDRAGQERINVIVRRNIKRRWQKLGVWNPQWGIPGRLNNSQSNDNASEWKWSWQDGDAATGWADSHGSGLNLQHPILRAVRLRRGVRRHEVCPVAPRSRLPDDVSASQAESFIISRPWFMYPHEVFEEERRFARVPSKRLWHYREPKGKLVTERWKLRGDWKEGWRDFITGKNHIGWKWRHETPSPEPEDLTPLNTHELEFTPSEVDALEAIPPPTPEPEQRYVSPEDPIDGPKTTLFGGPRRAPSNPTDKQKARRSSSQSLLPRQRRRQQTRVGPTQPPRRSARIAAMKAKRPPPSKDQRSITQPIPASPPAIKSTLRGGRRREANRSAVSKASFALPKRRARSEGGGGAYEAAERSHKEAKRSEVSPSVSRRRETLG